MTENHDIELKSKALEKMLVEMNEEHSTSEDRIHTWLCNQISDELFKGVLKDGKTIKGAMKYCFEQAQSMAVEGNAMVDDDTVYAWVSDYFIKVEVEKPKTEKPKVKNPIKKETKKSDLSVVKDKPKEKASKEEDDDDVIKGQQLNLFEMWK